MSKPFDASLKDLIAGYPSDWLSFLSISATEVEIIDADVSTVSADADKVFRIASDHPFLLHLELQSSPRTEPSEQLQWYNTLLRHRHRLPVRTIILLLRPEADSPRYNGIYQDAFPGEPPYLEFHYQVVRLWQIPVEEILSGGLGILPLALLGDVEEAAFPGVLHRMNERLEREANSEQEPLLWTAAYILTGLRLPPEALFSLFQGVSLMRESSAFQLMRAEGAVLELKKVIRLQGRQRFGPPEAATNESLEAIMDLERLERMAERMLVVNSWEQLLSTP